MEFDAWQIDRLRVALNNYRLFKARNGQLRPWQTVCDDIVFEPPEKGQPPKRGALPDFKGEALRRFANGTQVLEAERLLQLNQFLIRQRLLGKDEMQEGPEELRGLLMTHGYIGNQSLTATLSLEKLGSAYATTARTQHPAREIHLTFARAESRLFARADEESIVLRHPAMGSGKHRKMDVFSMRELRRGIAFATTTADLLHVYLVGASKCVEVTYTQLSAVEPPPNPGALVLLRLGGDASLAMSESNSPPLATHHAYVFHMRTE